MTEYHDGLSLLIALFEEYFVTNDWTPNCDECGDDGCKACDFGRLYNHRPPLLFEPFYAEDHLGKW